MKLILKQRMLSWFDSFDIYDEFGETAFVVKGKLSWGHLLEIYDNSGTNIGTIKEEIFRFLPQFCLYQHNHYLGKIKQELTFFNPTYTLDFNGWQVNGDLFLWDYNITDMHGRTVAIIEKQLFNWTDTYTIEILSPEDTLFALMVVLAIDCAKCSKGNG